MSDVPFKFMWLGKPVEDLSREELLTVIQHLSSELESHRTPQSIRASALGRVEMMKRGEA